MSITFTNIKGAFWLIQIFKVFLGVGLIYSCVYYLAPERLYKSQESLRLDTNAEVLAAVVAFSIIAIPFYYIGESIIKTSYMVWENYIKWIHKIAAKKDV